MNKQILLDLLSNEASKNAERYYRNLLRSKRPFEMLVGRCDLPVTLDVPRDSEKALADTRVLLKDYVDVTSFLLNKHFRSSFSASDHPGSI